MSSSTTSDCSCRISTDFDILRQTDLFSGIPAEVIKLFAYLTRHRVYQPGESILKQGEKAEHCFLVIRGRIDISILHRGADRVVLKIKPNSVFGELALLARLNWFFTATAVTETELLIIDRESFQKILEKYPDIRERITEKIIQLRISRFESQTVAMLDRLIDAGLETEFSAHPVAE